MAEPPTSGRGHGHGTSGGNSSDEGRNGGHDNGLPGSHSSSTSQAHGQENSGSKSSSAGRSGKHHNGPSESHSSSGSGRRHGQGTSVAHSSTIGRDHGHGTSGPHSSSTGRSRNHGQETSESGSSSTDRRHGQGTSRSRSRSSSTSTGPSHDPEISKSSSRLTDELVGRITRDFVKQLKAKDDAYDKLNKKYQNLKKVHTEYYQKYKDEKELNRDLEMKNQILQSLQKIPPEPKSSQPSTSKGCANASTSTRSIESDGSTGHHSGPHQYPTVVFVDSSFNQSKSHSESRTQKRRSSPSTNHSESRTQRRRSSHTTNHSESRTQRRRSSHTTNHSESRTQRRRSSPTTIDYNHSESRNQRRRSSPTMIDYNHTESWTQRRRLSPTTIDYNHVELVPPPAPPAPTFEFTRRSKSQNGKKRDLPKDNSLPSKKIKTESEEPVIEKRRPKPPPYDSDNESVLINCIAPYLAVKDIFKCRIVSKKWKAGVRKELDRRAPVLTSDWNDKKSPTFDWNKYKYPYYTFFYSQQCIENFLKIFKKSTELPFSALKIYGAPHDLYDKFTLQFGCQISTIFLNDRSLVTKYNMCRIHDVFPNLHSLWYNDRNETQFKYSSFELRGIQKLVMNVNRNNKLDFINGTFRNKLNVNDLRELRLENFGLGDHGLTLRNNCRNLKVLETTICPITDKGVLLQSIVQLQKLILCIDASYLAGVPGGFESYDYERLGVTAGAFLNTQVKSLKELELAFKISVGNGNIDLGYFTLPELEELEELKIDTTKSNRVRPAVKLIPIDRNILPRLKKLSLSITTNEIEDINGFCLGDLPELDMKLIKCITTGRSTPPIMWSSITPTGIQKLSLETDSLSTVQSVFNTSYATTVQHLKLVIKGLPQFDEAFYSNEVGKILAGFTSQELFDNTNDYQPRHDVSFYQYMAAIRTRPGILDQTQLRSVYIEWKYSYKLKLDYDTILHSLTQLKPLAQLTLRNIQLSEVSKSLLRRRHPNFILD